MKSYKKDKISITPNYFDTLQFQENTLFNTQKPSRRKKKLYFRKCICWKPRPCGDDTVFWGDTMLYKYATNRPVTTPTFTVDRNTSLSIGSMLVDMLTVQQQPRRLCQMLCSY